MCRIERFNLIFPDDTIEPRERIVNCERGTPSNPCARREYVTLFNDYQATQEDIEQRARETALLVRPRFDPPSVPESRIRTDHSSRNKASKVGGIGGLEFELKLRNPFSSKRRRGKAKERENMARRSNAEPESRINIVEAIPRAPSPPPAVRRPEMEPLILDAAPRRSITGSQDEEPKQRRRRRKHRHRTVVIHQEGSEDASTSESESDDSPSPTRRHQPPKPTSSSPTSGDDAAAIKERREKRRSKESDPFNPRSERILEAEREARVRAEREHASEMRREERRRRSARNSPQDPQPLSQGELAAQQQYKEDQAILRAERHQNQYRESPPPSPSNRLTQIHQSQNPQLLSPTRGHRRNGSYEETGVDFIQGAVEAARRRRESSSVSGEGSHYSSGSGESRRRNGRSS